MSFSVKRCTSAKQTLHCFKQILHRVTVTRRHQQALPVDPVSDPVLVRPLLHFCRKPGEPGRALPPKYLPLPRLAVRAAVGRTCGGMGPGEKRVCEPGRASPHGGAGGPRNRKMFGSTGADVATNTGCAQDSEIYARKRRFTIWEIRRLRNIGVARRRAPRKSLHAMCARTRGCECLACEMIPFLEILPSSKRGSAKCAVSKDYRRRPLYFAAFPSVCLGTKNERTPKFRFVSSPPEEFSDIRRGVASWR
jgi:hypothetical protein